MRPATPDNGSPEPRGLPARRVRQREPRAKRLDRPARAAVAPAIQAKGAGQRIETKPGRQRPRGRVIRDQAKRHRATVARPMVRRAGIRSRSETSEACCATRSRRHRTWGRASRWLLLAVGIALASLFVPSVAAVSAAETPATAFERGVAAAQSGDFETALEAFQRAQHAGMDSAGLYFNLGVAYFRTGETTAARRAFQAAIERGEMVAPAAFNLGRIAAEADEPAVARRWFQRAAEAAQTEQVRQRALARLDNQPPRRFAGSLRAGVGHDSNVAAAPSSGARQSERSDSFGRFSGYGRYVLDDHWSLDGQAYTERYRDEDDFDLTFLRTGLRWQGNSVDGQRTGAKAGLRAIRFGGESAERALLIGADQRLSGLSEAGDLVVDGQISARDGQDPFAYLDGTGYRLGIEWQSDSRGSDWSSRLELARVDRDDLTLGNEFFSFSWTGIEWSGQWRPALPGPLSFELSASLAERRYDDAERRAGRDLGRRDATRYRTAAALSGPLAAAWSWRAEVTVEGRDSGLDRFDYDRTVAALDVATRF